MMSRALAVFAVSMSLVWAAQAREAANDGYLAHGTAMAPLGWSAPPRPEDPLVLELDLDQVRDALPPRNSTPFQEAAADADAYDAPDVVRRFDDAVGARLDEADRPLLVAMLEKVIVDTGAYVDVAKQANPRPRPYVEDPAVKAGVCDFGYLAGTERQSYPSGHAMNGYVVALVLAEVFPAERRPAILARGVRYGDNRVACGVHHPIDVEIGRRLGIAYYSRLKDDPVFRADLDCAKAEEAAAEDKTRRLPSACAAERARIERARAAASRAADAR